MVRPRHNSLSPCFLFYSSLKKMRIPEDLENMLCFKWALLYFQLFFLLQESVYISQVQILVITTPPGILQDKPMILPRRKVFNADPKIILSLYFILVFRGSNWHNDAIGTAGTGSLHFPDLLKNSNTVPRVQHCLTNEIFFISQTKYTTTSSCTAKGGN